MKYFHTAISVKNLDISRKFYEVVFNMKFRSQGERPELNSRFINLEDESGGVVELFEHKDSIPLDDDLMNFQKVGIKHIAFIVDNIEDVIDSAQNNGAKILWPIKNGITVKRIAFISDPDGIPIELVE
jgi:catechol 2,3-dioxygenase-like lactoylglutathione lyase family enzyme